MPETDTITRDLPGTALTVHRPKDTLYPDRWGIGGGDVAAVLGMNPYRSPHDVWLQATGRVQPQESHEALEVGLELEGWILKRYSIQSGIPFLRTADLCLRDRKNPYKRAHLDGMCVERRLVADAKVVGIRQAKYWGQPGSDEVPDYIYLQQEWYLSLLDWEASHLPAFRWDDRYRITGYIVGRSPKLEARMHESVERFWEENVTKDIPPPVTATELTTRYLRDAFPKEKTPLREATIEECEWANTFRQTREAIENLKPVLADVSTKLQASIGDAEGIAGPFGFITYKKVKDTVGVNWEAIARDLAKRFVSEDTLEAYINANTGVTRKGSRRFLPRFEGEEETQ